MIGDLPVDVLLRDALLPMVALQVMIVAFYIIYVSQTWRGMPWREAVIYAPLAIPLLFAALFVLANIASGSRPLTDFLGSLALVTVIPWLAGMATGAITYSRVKRRRD